MKLQFVLRTLHLFIVVLILLPTFPHHAYSETFFYPNPESNTVTEASLASDSQRLITFYCYTDPEKDPWNPSMKYGGLKEWHEEFWRDLWEDSGYGTNYCSTCDTDVRDNVIVASHKDSRYGSIKAAHHSNYSGVWQRGTEATFYSINSPKVAFAFGVPYITFTSIGSGGLTKVYIECLYGCAGLPELSGTYRYSTSVGSASLAGDIDAFYSAFVSILIPTDFGRGCVNVRKLTRTDDDYLGDCFSNGDEPYGTNIVLYQNYPVVTYKADGGQALWVSQWNGASWVNIGTDTVGAGLSFGRLRAAASSSKLFVGFEVLGGDRHQISVYEFKDSEWVLYPVLIDAASSSNYAFQDLAVFQGRPIVAYTKDGVLKIVNLFGNGKTRKVPFQPALLLLLGDS